MNIVTIDVSDMSREDAFLLMSSMQDEYFRNAYVELELYLSQSIVPLQHIKLNSRLINPKITAG